MVGRKKPQGVSRSGLKRWIVLLFLIALCFLVGKIFLSYRKRVWQKGRFNFVFAAEPVLVLSLSPREESLTVVLIPQNTYIEAARSFGLYRAEAIYPLGELDGMGGQLLKGSVQEFLGVPIEGYIRINPKFEYRNSKFSQEELIDLKKRVVSWRVFLKPQKALKFIRENLATDLTFWDMARIWLQAKKVGSGKVNLIDLEKSGVLSPFHLPDGQVGKIGDPLLIDNLLKDFFLEPTVRSEKIAVEVLNGTDTPGLAGRAARIITNMGGKVTHVGESQERFDRSLLRGNKQVLGSLTAFKIRKLFDCRVVEEGGEILNLTVGREYKNQLFSRD